MAKRIENGDTVTLECTGKLENGMVFTNPREDGPIKFEVGSYQVVKGFNHAVIGMGVGEMKKVVLTPSDAFGEYDDNLIIDCPLDRLPENIQKGMPLKSQEEKGNYVIWTVKDIQSADEKAVLDANHLLAGREVHYELRVVEIE